VEHAILHLLYSRFIVKVLRDMGLVEFSEPFERLFTQGMICKDGHKMSKSKGNVVAPDALIEKYGADTVRLYTLFIGPPEKDAEWNDRGVEGAYRFLTRYWKMIEDHAAAAEVSTGATRPGSSRPSAGWSPSGPARDLRRRVHEVTAQILEDMDRLHLNTAVSGLMQIVNAVHDFGAAGGDPGAPEVVEAAELATRLLAPLAPHTAEGAWERLGHPDSIFRSAWPQVSREALARDMERIVVQVNGRVRAQLEIPAGSDGAAARAAAEADARVRKFLEGKTVRQVIHVPGRLVNLVVS
jgi:leucyl-tRNA synthetase